MKTEDVIRWINERANLNDLQRVADAVGDRVREIATRADTERLGSA